MHREANTGPERLARIVEGLNATGRPSSSPRTRARARRSTSTGRARAELHAIAPLGYLDLLALVARRE